MKLSHLLLIISSVLFTVSLYSCAGKNSSIFDSIEIKNYKKIELQISNKNCDSIGYQIFQGDENVGIKSLFVYGDNIYLTDVYHSNVKKLNIKDGTIKSSVCLSNLPSFKSGIWLRDIAIFDDKVFVTSDADSVYVFTIDLNYLETIICKRGQKTVFKISNDSLLFYLGSEQQKNTDIKFDLLLVEKNLKISSVSKILNVGDFMKRKKESETKGIVYHTFSKNGKYFIKLPTGIIELKEPIPQINEYSTNNIHFTDKYLVYFNCEPTKLTLHIYEW